MDLHVGVVGLQEVAQDPACLPQVLHPPGKIAVALLTDAIHAARRSCAVGIPARRDKAPLFQRAKDAIDSAGIDGILVKAELLQPLNQVVPVALDTVEEQQQTRLDEALNASWAGASILPGAPTTTVSPDTATDDPRFWKLAEVIEDSLACWVQIPPARTNT